jgi:hypothetical protein
MATITVVVASFAIGGADADFAMHILLCIFTSIHLSFFSKRRYILMLSLQSARAKPASLADGGNMAAHGHDDDDNFMDPPPRSTVPINLHPQFLNVQTYFYVPNYFSRSF